MKARWSGLLAMVVLAQAGWTGPSSSAGQVAASNVPQFSFEGMEAPERDLVQGVMDRPTLHARGNQESFSCRPEHFYWFLIPTGP